VQAQAVAHEERMHIGPRTPYVALDVERDLTLLSQVERRQEIACCPQNRLERHPGLAHGEQSRPDVAVGCDATEFLAQRFPGPHKHTLQEFGIPWRRLIRRHRQAAPKWRPVVGRAGAERMRVIVTHVKPRSVEPDLL
jgi:hypothetical protein